jgi:hypothetical protein
MQGRVESGLSFRVIPLQEDLLVLIMVMEEVIIIIIIIISFIIISFIIIIPRHSWVTHFTKYITTPIITTMGLRARPLR